jgi:predicted transglutaminase-like cysteine proteinase
MVRRVFNALLFMLVSGAFTIAISSSGYAQSFGDLLRSTQGTPTGAFGSMAIAVKPQSGLNPAAGWHTAMTKMQQDRVVLERCIADPGRCAGEQRAWAEMVRAASGMSRAAQLERVNAFFNRFPYRTDEELYGRSEYWAGPVEFLARSGDCEDYAIAKFFTLRELGFGDADLKVVVVDDTARGVGHAVLTARLDGTDFVLDNLSANVVPESGISYYVALASMNEGGVWVDVPSLHRRRGWDRMASLQ